MNDAGRSEPVNAAPEVSDPVRRGPRLPAKLMALCVVGMVCLAFCEVAIRLFAPQPASWLDIYRRHPSLEIYAILPEIERHVDTGESRWSVFTDADGFRVTGGTGGTGASREIAAPLCLGDSFPFGQGVLHEDCFVGRLQSLGRPELDFINTSVPGYGPIQYRQVLEYLLGLGRAPGRVLVSVYLGNDFHDCVWKEKPANLDNIVDGIIGNRGDLKSAIKRRSHMYRLASKVYHRFSKGGTNSYEFRRSMFDAESWSTGILKKGKSRFELEFAAIAKICADREIELDVLLIPTEDALEFMERSDSSDGAGNPNLPMEKATQILDALGIRSLDLTAALSVEPVGDLYFAHDGHFTPFGHEIAAKAIIAHYASPERDSQR